MNTIKKRGRPKKLSDQIQDVTTVAKELYKASIKIGPLSYVGEGETVRDAISNIPFKGKPFGMSILKVSKGNLTREKIISNIHVSRLFSASPTMRQVALKSISMIFSL